MFFGYADFSKSCKRLDVQFSFCNVFKGAVLLARWSTDECLLLNWNKTSKQIELLFVHEKLGIFS